MNETICAKAIKGFADRQYKTWLETSWIAYTVQRNNMTPKRK